MIDINLSNLIFCIDYIHDYIQHYVKASEIQGEQLFIVIHL